MTTNQTIDGVPRSICHACVSYPRDAYCPVCDPAAQPQGEPVALFSNGFTTLEIGGGKYRIITQYKNRDDAWSDYTALCKAEQPAPVAVVMPGQVKVLHRFEDDPISQAQAQGWNACLDEVARLNAAQPVPVAVVLPMRALDQEDGAFFDKGWNACLDQLKRLNPSL